MEKIVSAVQPLVDASKTGRLGSMTLLFEAINLRIVRLAAALDVSLQNEAEVNRVLNRRKNAMPVAIDRRIRADSSKAHKWEELQALLVMRYDLEVRYVDQVGIAATRQILIEAEESMMRKGFHLGDDGINLERLFESPQASLSRPV